MTLRPLFLYWGRKGITALTFEIAEALARRPNLTWRLSVSRQNEAYASFEQFGDRLVPVDTFARGIGTLFLWRPIALARRLSRLVRAERITDVVTLMPHVWSALVGPAMRRAGASYHTVLHDAQLHPGDRTGLMHPVLLRDLTGADSVITLSDSVAEQALARRLVPPERLIRLFHPARSLVVRRAIEAPLAGEPWRMLFLGRIQAYKGLPLLIEAVSRLRQDGHNVVLSVMGEGLLGADARRLAALGACVVNRWLDEAEMSAALANHHAVVLPYLEASQSGVAASAVGAGVPLIATPVGGLNEQIIDGGTGLLAARPDAQSLTDALARLITTPGLHAALTDAAWRRRQELSTDRFVACLLDKLQEKSGRLAHRNASSIAA